MALCIGTTNQGAVSHMVKHVAGNSKDKGRRTFFLMDEQEIGDTHTATCTDAEWRQCRRVPQPSLRNPLGSTRQWHGQRHMICSAGWCAVPEEQANLALWMGVRTPTRTHCVIEAPRQNFVSV